MKHIVWNNPRKTTLPLNILLFNWDKMVRRRNKRQWVFGGREGHQYDDNARYLFEYVNKTHPEIKTAWLCQDEELAQRIRCYGYNAYTFSSKEGKAFAKKAGVAIYSHGLIDFGIFPRVGGATIVSLWHGAGFKKVYNSTYTGFALYLKKMLDKFFSWTCRDITTTTSEFCNREFADCFGLVINKDKMFVTGQPRNDVFKSNLKKTEVLKKVAGVDASKRIVLYMPTYRMSTLGKDRMANIVKDLYYSKSIDEVLNKTNSILIAKLHPLTPHIDVANRDNFIILDYGAVKDNQALMGIGDIMITDYSSTCVDFALLNRPVIFYLPDHEEFIEKSEPLYDEFFKICRNTNCNSPEDLAKLIENPSLDATNAINDVFEDTSIAGTIYSENVYKVVAKEINF